MQQTLAGQDSYVGKRDGKILKLEKLFIADKWLQLPPQVLKKEVAKTLPFSHRTETRTKSNSCSLTKNVI